MSAMVWYDWQTSSIWSQPWGTAIAGPLKGTQLDLVPFELVPYSTWIERHPDTRVLIDEHRPQYYSPQYEMDNYVIGVAIADAAIGFHFGNVAEQGVVNELVGDVPIVVLVDPDTRDIDVFLREPVLSRENGNQKGNSLTFTREFDESISDVETGSTWDVRRGVATAGPLRGAILRRAPFISSYDWSWVNFHPETDLWGYPAGWLR